ncbi:MAG: Na/Pi cotransporter family protein, partial [Muribaculaceae bacterium]|nr:Na/Pi cotransporter family protein [Muribaculaceae bacterium]
VDTMYGYVKEAMELLNHALENIENVSSKSLIESYNKEREINNFRNTLRNGNVENINDKHYEYQAGIYYMDLISDLEKTGDYIINVVDTLRDTFKKLH